MLPYAVLYPGAGAARVPRAPGRSSGGCDASIGAGTWNCVRYIVLSCSGSSAAPGFSVRRLPPHKWPAGASLHVASALTEALEGLCSAEQNRDAVRCRHLAERNH